MTVAAQGPLRYEDLRGPGQQQNSGPAPHGVSLSSYSGSQILPPSQQQMRRQNLDDLFDDDQKYYESVSVDIEHEERTKL